MTAPSPMAKLGEALRRNTLVRIIEKFGEEHADSHLKDLVIDERGPGARSRCSAAGSSTLARTASSVWIAILAYRRPCAAD